MDGLLGRVAFYALPYAAGYFLGRVICYEREVRQMIGTDLTDRNIADFIKSVA